MKLSWIPFLIALSFCIAGAANASPALAETHCGKCHEMDKKKKGPSYKAMAAKFKGDEAKALAAIGDPKGDHPEVKTKPDELKAVVKWVLTQQ